MSPAVGQSQRSDGSFERLYRRHRRDVYGAVLRDVRDPEEAEDVTQIAFLNAYRAISRGEEPEKPRAWLVTIARNVVRRRYRAMARRPQEVRLDPEVAAAVMDVEGPTAGEIVAAIRKLPPNQRAAILLREIQGCSYGEIASKLGLSLAAVETLIFRARKRLSEHLEAADHVPAARPRLSRALAFLPLPGLGKLGSLGLSVSRAGVAAFVGGVAVVVGPPGDSSPALQVRPAVKGPASFVAVSGYQPPAADVTTATPTAVAKRPKKAGSKRSGAKHESTETQNESGATDSVAGIQLPSVPDSEALPLPPLPVDLPPLPVPDLPPPPPLPG